MVPLRVYVWPRKGSGENLTPDFMHVFPRCLWGLYLVTEFYFLPFPSGWLDPAAYTPSHFCSAFSCVKEMENMGNVVARLPQPSESLIADNLVGKAVANLQPSLAGEQAGYFTWWLVFIPAEHLHLSLRPHCSVAAELFSLLQSCRNHFPLSFPFGSSNLASASHSCSPAPVVQPKQWSSGTPQTELMLAALDPHPPSLSIEFSFCFPRQIICCDSYCFLSFAAWTGSMHHFVLKDAEADSSALAKTNEVLAGGVAAAAGFAVPPYT